MKWDCYFRSLSAKTRQRPQVGNQTFRMAHAVRPPALFHLSRGRKALAVPVAWESGTKQFDLNQFFTTSWAELSTLVRSLPEKAPPPCALPPPRVLMIGMRPVRPASPWSPLEMTCPDGGINNMSRVTIKSENWQSVLEDGIFECLPGHRLPDVELSPRNLEILDSTDPLVF